MLKDIFKMQQDLNNYVFKKNNIKDKSGNDLNMQTIMAAVEKNQIMVNKRFSHFSI